MQPFPTLFHSDKTLSGFTGWSPPEPETGYMWFDAPLEIGGVTEVNFLLHGGCYGHHPDCNVTFELRIGRTPGKRCVPLGRIDWRSLQGGHSNPRKGDPEWSGKRVSDTHFHDFELNWSSELGRMRGVNLPLAREIEQELQSFADVRSYAGNRFRINNIDLVSEPEWEYRLA